MIRPFRPDDLDTLADIGNRAWKPIYDMFRQVYGDDKLALVTPDTATAKGEQVRSHCQRAPEWVFVAEEEDRIVGFATCRLDRDSKTGEIGNNAVDPDCGLKGIGQQLYAAVLAYFRQEGMAAAKVGTGLDWAHAPARRAYERAGFNIKHENVTYWQKL